MSLCVSCNQILNGKQLLYCSNKCKQRIRNKKNKVTAKEGLAKLLKLGFIDENVDPNLAIVIKNGVLLDANIKGLPLNQTHVGDTGYCLFGKGYGFVALHRVIIELHGQQLVSPNVTDHKNRNKLDNRYENLHIVTLGVNSRNSATKQTKTKSKYKGVHRTASGKWQAQVWMDGKNKCFGSYMTEEEAALMYNQVVLEHFGDEAYLNVV